MTLDSVPLKWTSRLTISAASRTPQLQGDKITLPQSALEQLLTAATTVQEINEPYDPFSSDTFGSHSRAAGFESKQNLPHPLIFRLVNPVNGNVAYAGIREFSAEDGQAGLSQFLRDQLGYKDESDYETAIVVHAAHLPKGKFVRLRPLESYENDDWKPLLERYLRNTFTTLVNGEVLAVPSGGATFRFLIDKILPEIEAICIIDTDLEVDIEPLNEEQARETLERRLKKNQKTEGSKGGSSPGGIIETEHKVSGQVLAGEHVDYTLAKWNPSVPIQVELNVDDTDLVDLYVNPLSQRQRNRPRKDEHVFSAVEGSPRKLRLESTNVELEEAEELYISVHAFQHHEGGEESNTPRAHRFSLNVTNTGSSIPKNAIQIDDTEDVSAHPDEIKCKNCHAWVPKGTLFLHENFCLRNNILCPKCDLVFQKTSPEWHAHWHCPHDSAHGNSAETHVHHDSYEHTLASCSACNESFISVRLLARHRTSTCPGKPILCRFCHLLVPQQGPEDPPATDPQVILSGLTPHELVDGARTADCSICNKPVRLRDLQVHRRHHDLERLRRPAPVPCSNLPCGRTLRTTLQSNAMGLCETCFAPLYASGAGDDRDGRALKRRVERRLLSQLLTGCGRESCDNLSGCRKAQDRLGYQRLTSKEASAVIKEDLEGLLEGRGKLFLCVDEEAEKRKGKADYMGAQDVGEDGVDNGYERGWYLRALEQCGEDVGRARNWLKDWAPTIKEMNCDM